VKSEVKTCYATLAADHTTPKPFFPNPAPEIDFPDSYLTFFMEEQFIKYVVAVGGVWESSRGAPRAPPGLLRLFEEGRVHTPLL